MLEDILYYIGQGLGIVAVVLGFISFQMKTPKGILAFQITIAFIFAAHYLFIGAPGAAALNLLAAVNNILYFFRAKRGGKGWFEPIFYVVMVTVTTIITWEAWYSVFVLLGIGINTYCMSLYDPQKVRKSIFVTSPLVLIYDIFAGAIGGSIYETVAWVSAIIGVIKYRKKK